MNQELKRQVYKLKPYLRLSVKQYINLLLVDIYCIRAVDFYQTSIKLETKSFVTNLYKID